MSRAGAPPRRSTGPIRAVDPRPGHPVAERPTARPSALGPRWRATPAVLAAWTALAAIVVAGQLLAPGRRAGGALRHRGAALPALAAAAGSASPAAAGSTSGAPTAPWHETLHAPRTPLLQPPVVGPLAPLAPFPLAPVAPHVAPGGSLAPTAATLDAPSPTPRRIDAPNPEHPLLPYLGGEHRFASPLIMPRLREGLKVKLPHLAKLPTVGRLFSRPSPGEPVPVLITAYCLQGTTRRGNSVRSGIVAADPRVFPLARHVELYAGGRFLGRFLVDDTGGKIKGQRIDIWTPDCADARRFGARRGVATLVAIGEARR